jgi:acetyl-CoA synthetase/medium-chain acyl-CoA synthetase
MSPERFNFARDVLDGLASDPGKLAIWWVDGQDNERKITFTELCSESRRACNALGSQGVGRGDVVVVILPRLIEWWVLNVACLRNGAVISPGPVQLAKEDIRYRLQRSEAACLITVPEVAARVDAVVEACPGVRSKIVVGGMHPGWSSYEELVRKASDTFETADTDADEIAAIYFTSGTSGYPKMTAHTHVSFPLRHAVTGRVWLDLNDGDLHWNFSDTGWAKAGWSSVYGPWNQGATVFVHHAASFDPAHILRLLARYPISTMCAAPTVYRMLLLEDVATTELRALRHCVAAGEPLNPEVVEQWRAATGITIREGYGQTETSLLVGSFPPMEVRPGSMGTPAPGFDVQIVDEEGEVLGPGDEGDVAVRVRPERPLGLFREYWKEPELTAAAYRGDWYITGDRAYRDEDGYFWFVGRADDVIISSGYRIGPFEVESTLLEHEAVAESAVVASPDPVRGEIVKAFVVLKPGYRPSDELAESLQRHVKQSTAPYKYPRAVEFVDRLPKTTSGKIKRAALRAAERSDSAARHHSWHRAGDAGTLETESDRVSKSDPSGLRENGSTTEPRQRGS